MTNTNERSLGEALRFHRLDASLKQSELGEALGYDTSHVSRIERGERAPTLAYLQEFIDHLNLSNGARSTILTLYNNKELTTPNQKTSASSQALQGPKTNWGDAPDVNSFYGREVTLSKLQRWLIDDQCRLIALFGIGGMGKTSLVTKVAQDNKVQNAFEYVFWQSLRHRPAIDQLLATVIRFFGDQKNIDLPQNIGQAISILINIMQEHRCLLILDNAESILQEDGQDIYYQPSYEPYGDLIQRIGETNHQSCLILTTREKPRELIALEDDTGPVRSLPLYGFDKPKDVQLILKPKGLTGTEDDWSTLIQRYSGNPLALKIAADMIRRRFNGDIARYLQFSQEDGSIPGDIRRVLAQTFERLSIFEQEILFWLAIEQEPVSPEILRNNMAGSISNWDLLDALDTLTRCSLLDRTGSLQNVVLEYTLSRFVEQVGQELISKNLGLFQSHSLTKADSKDYLRNNQKRLIVEPILNQLYDRIGDTNAIETQLRQLLDNLRQAPNLNESNYAAGNILNLLIVLGSDLRQYSFADLPIRQVYLRDTDLSGVNFSRSNLISSAFADTFGSIFSVAICPHGQFLAVGTSDNEIRVWEIENRKQLFILQGHTGWVRSLDFNAEGDLLISGSSDHTVRIWDLQTGECRQVLAGHTNRIRAVSCHPKAAILATCSDDKTVRIWNISTGQSMLTLRGHTDSIRSVVFSPDGQQVVSGGLDQTIRLWNANTGKLIQTFEQESHKVDSLAFHPQGKKIVAGYRNNAIRIWDVNSGECLNTILEHSDRIRTLSFSPDGHILASGSYDKTIKLWSFSNTPRLLQTLRGHTNWVRSLAFGPNHSYIVSGSDDKTVRFWDIDSGQCWETFQGDTNWVWTLALSPDGNNFISGSEDSIIRFWDIQTEQCIRKFNGHHNRVNSVHFSPDGQHFASSSDDQTIRVWRTNTSKSVKILKGHTDRVSDIKFSADGQMLASASSDHQVRLWDLPTGNGLGILEGHQGAVWSVDFSPTDKLIASSSDDQTIRIWNLEDFTINHILRGHEARVSTVAFSPDGATLASGSDDQTIQLWDTASGNSLRTLIGHTGRIWSVAFAPDQSVLASSSEDYTIILWDATTGQTIHKFEGHTSRVRDIVFRHDGQMLASASDDGTIRFWHTESAACLMILSSDRLYERMNITGITGPTSAEKRILKELGAIEDEPE